MIPQRNRHIVEWIKSANEYLGSRIGVTSAEPFCTKEPIGLTSLESLTLL